MDEEQATLDRLMASETYAEAVECVRKLFPQMSEEEAWETVAYHPFRREGKVDDVEKIFLVSMYEFYKAKKEARIAAARPPHATFVERAEMVYNYELLQDLLKSDDANSFTEKLRYLFPQIGKAEAKKIATMPLRERQRLVSKIWLDVMGRKYQPASLSELKDLVVDKSIHLSAIDVSKITDMHELFKNSIREDYAGMEIWDVSNVTNMSGIFKEARKFNHPIGDWDVSNVTDMSYMFCYAVIFNQPIGDWDVSNVTNMSSMFFDAREFNQAIGNWNVSKVIDMVCMFCGACEFNQSIINWDVSNVTAMCAMFDSAFKYNQPLAKWDVSNVTDMFCMFNMAVEFNQPIGNWNVSNVTVMNGMFSDARSFDQPLENWDVSNVTDMRFMFSGAEAFKQSLKAWHVSSEANLEDIGLAEELLPVFDER